MSVPRSIWRVVFIVGIGAALACTPRGNGGEGTSSSSSGSVVTDGGAGQGDGGGVPDAAVEADASVQDDAGVQTDAGTDAGPVLADAGVDADAGMSSEDGGLPPYLENCDSLFAARILERQIERDGTFPNDCTTPLRNDIGLLKAGGDPLCNAGESANACRLRHYNSPPSLDGDLPPGCWNGTGPTSCLRGAWLPRCVNGADAGCAEPEVICHDGTRPLIYAEAATTGASNTWIIHMGGEGGPCNGLKCWGNYRYSHLTGTDEFETSLSSLHPDHPTPASHNGAGIMSGAPVAANPFASYNRVRFERCSDAASNGIETVPVADGIPPELAAEYPTAPIMTRRSTTQVFHKGYNVWTGLFHTLAAGNGLDLNADGTPDLPSLANGTKIVLSASSDASNWLVYAADRLAAELRAIAGNDVEVRVLVDGLFEPGLDNEGRYPAGAPANFNLFANPYSDTGLCELPDNGDAVANEACSDAAYQPGSGLRTGYALRGLLRDVSCETMHGVDAPECFDKIHTMLNHLETPILVLADQEDNTVSDNAPAYADDRSYFWEEPGDYRVRILDQGRDVAAHWPTAAREEGAGTPGNFALILPKARRDNEPWGQATHVRFHVNERMAAGMTRCTAAGTAVDTVAFGTMIGDWLTNPSSLSYVAEDAARWDGSSEYWVTGQTCRAPE